MLQVTFIVTWQHNVRLGAFYLRELRWMMSSRKRSMKPQGMLMILMRMYFQHPGALTLHLRMMIDVGLVSSTYILYMRGQEL